MKRLDFRQFRALARYRRDPSSSAMPKPKTLTTLISYPSFQLHGVLEILLMTRWLSLMVVFSLKTRSSSQKLRCPACNYAWSCFHFLNKFHQWAQKWRSSYEMICGGKIFGENVVRFCAHYFVLWQAKVVRTAMKFFPVLLVASLLVAKADAQKVSTAARRSSDDCHIPLT